LTTPPGTRPLILMHTPDATTIAESIQTQLGADTGFITSAVVSFATVDGEGQERIVVVYDGTLLAAAKLAEYSAERLEQIIYNGKPEDGDEG